MQTKITCNEDECKFVNEEGYCTKDNIELRHDGSSMLGRMICKEAEQTN